MLTETEKSELKSLKKRLSDVNLDLRKRKQKRNKLINQKKVKTESYKILEERIKKLLNRKHELTKELGKLEIKKLKK